MNHDCEATNERLVDLLFGEIEAVRDSSLLEEIGRCAECLGRYRSMAETLNVFDAASEATLPAEEFWLGYEERLRKRMSQEIRNDLWQQTAFPFARGEYQLTFVEGEGLTRRLIRELKGVGRDAELTWPDFKRDPFGFTSRSVAAYTRAAWGFFSQRNVALATLSSFLLISLLLGSVYALERLRASRAALTANANEGLEFKGWVGDEIPKEQETPDKGPAGMNEGKGGGSKDKYEKPHGGGGGGRREESEASVGKLPTAQLVQPILTANPHPSAVPNPHLPTPVTMNVDPLLAKDDTRDIPYGLPNSTATTPSSGSGSGGGMGTGSGGGMGQGEGTGQGPGTGFNMGGGEGKVGGGDKGGGGGGVDYDKTFKQSEVSVHAVITYKPEPGFTEEARRENVTGMVRLRAVLSASGEVTNISVIKGLPDGLTERAINAARQIKFRPAQKDGHIVSQYIVLEYNFNIY
jgi:TonB family protein